MTPFEASAYPLVAGLPDGERIVKVLDGLYTRIRDTDWQGACHATTACGVVLLAAQRISAAPCIGEVLLPGIPLVAFDHSWMEIDGMIFDVAITNPLVRELVHPAVIAGRRIDNGEPTKLVYGGVSGCPPDPPAREIAKMTIGQYMDGFPADGGLWKVAKEVAAGSEIDVPLFAQVRAATRAMKWAARPSPRSDDTAPENNDRERNRRKRMRQGRR